MTTKQIPLSDLPPHSTYGVNFDARVVAISKAICTPGYVLPPIEVLRRKNGAYEIRDGHVRVHVMRGQNPAQMVWANITEEQ